MPKNVSSDILNGRFVVGSRSAAAFNAVEGLRVSDRVERARQQSDAADEMSGAIRTWWSD